MDGAARMGAGMMSKNDSTSNIIPSRNAALVIVSNGKPK
jgi:hypothetical protein